MSTEPPSGLGISHNRALATRSDPSCIRLGRSKDQCHWSFLAKPTKGVAAAKDTGSRQQTKNFIQPGAGKQQGCGSHQGCGPHHQELGKDKAGRQAWSHQELGKGKPWQPRKARQAWALGWQPPPRAWQGQSLEATVSSRRGLGWPPPRAWQAAKHLARTNQPPRALTKLGSHQTLGKDKLGSQRWLSPSKGWAVTKAWAATTKSLAAIDLRA